VRGRIDLRIRGINTSTFGGHTTPRRVTGSLRGLIF
jgi:hypothetical protein